MPKNHSVPTDIILPHIIYRNVADAITWLNRTFGFREYYRYGEPAGQISGALIHLGDAWIILKRAQEYQGVPTQLGYGTQSLTIFVNDVDSHYNRTKSEGARIVEEIHETEYGELQYGVQDLDGHHWLFSQHAHDINPKLWGARLAEQ